jgi:hypothetical protein
LDESSVEIINVGNDFAEIYAGKAGGVDQVIRQR